MTTQIPLINAPTPLRQEPFGDAAKDTSCVGAGCPGCYTLDCYCDRKSGAHCYGEFPHQFTAETGTSCRKQARKKGWRLDYRNDVFLCPKCNPRSPYKAAAKGEG